MLGLRPITGGTTMSGEGGYETLEVTRPQEWVVQVQLNRPEKSNAMNRAFWRYRGSSLPHGFPPYLHSSSPSLPLFPPPSHHPSLHPTLPPSLPPFLHPSLIVLPSSASRQPPCICKMSFIDSLAVLMPLHPPIHTHREMRECFGCLATDQECRAVVVSGAGKNFSAGLDLMVSE